MRSKHYIPLLLFGVIVGILFYSLRFSTISSSDLDIISSLNLKLVEDEKETLDLTKFKGRPYILHVFASWCEACKEDYPLLKEVNRQSNISIIGLAVRDEVDKIKKMDFSALPYTKIAVASENVPKLIRSGPIPETLVINSEGIIIFRHLGSLNNEIVAKNIIPLLK